MFVDRRAFGGFNAKVSPGRFGHKAQPASERWDSHPNFAHPGSSGAERLGARNGSRSGRLPGRLPPETSKATHQTASNGGSSKATMVFLNKAEQANNSLASKGIAQKNKQPNLVAGDASPSPWPPQAANGTPVLHVLNPNQ